MSAVLFLEQEEHKQSSDYGLCVTNCVWKYKLEEILPCLGSTFDWGLEVAILSVYVYDVDGKGDGVLEELPIPPP